jgi:ribosome assembly protein YihI (activator of Der GTPase)
MPTRSIEMSQNRESAAPKQRNTEANAPRRRKTPSGGSNPKKAPPQAVVSTATQTAAAKTPAKARQPEASGERLTKRERLLTLLSQPEGARMMTANRREFFTRGMWMASIHLQAGTNGVSP